MRQRISAIIIDTDKEKHDYSLVKSSKFNEFCEDSFDIVVLKDTKNISKILKEQQGYDCIITIGNEDIWGELSYMPYEVRKKWNHIEEFDRDVIANTIITTFLGNIGRERGPEEKLFSIFTCTFNTKKEDFLRLYNSLVAQEYTNWNWWVLDDSIYNNKIEDYINKLQDYRIHLIKNISHHGNIGYNKHLIASICDGDYLVEVDHDDELTADCLKELNRAFNEYPDTDFVYSDCCEILNNKVIVYNDGNDTWGYGEGLNLERNVNGKNIKISATPLITPYSIRTIHTQPNHVRCWKSSFYKMIGGHNYDLSVLDDMDILIRTFLNGKITKIEKVLYLQYEGEGERGVSSESAQSKRFAEIQRSAILLKEKYDKDIHERIINLGYHDDPWIDEYGYSDIWKEHEVNNIMCNILK